MLSAHASVMTSPSVAHSPLPAAPEIAKTKQECNSSRNPFAKDQNILIYNEERTFKVDRQNTLNLGDGEHSSEDSFAGFAAHMSDGSFSRLVTLPYPSYPNDRQVLRRCSRMSV